jgi:hypothetical protein
MQVFVPKETFRITMSLADLQTVFTNGSLGNLYLADAVNVLKILIPSFYPIESPVLVTFSPPVPLTDFAAAHFGSTPVSHLQ